MNVHVVTDPADPRLADYRSLKERHLKDESGRFVAESEGVVRNLISSNLRVLSVLVTAPHLARLEPVLPEGVPIYVAAQEVMDGITGFHVHRGCLAIGERPRDVTVPQDARTVVVLEDLVDVDNVGALARNAAGFGADALVLSPRCADPFYRKAIRVSMGAVFALPIVRAARWPEDLLGLRQHGMALVGAVLDRDAQPLSTFAAPDRVAVILGGEGPGLRAETKALCDHLVTIPMFRADSLNVATAGAIFLYALSRR